VPLTESTFHLIGEKELKMMHTRAMLVNTSRGSVVDEKALYQALTNDQIAGAALDVFEIEPPFENKLLGLENTVCTPHIAAYTHETLRRMDAACVATLAKSLRELKS
jgi:D-3-phosphoglycerate dehydrogenase